MGRVALGLPQTVLGADAAVEGGGAVVDDRGEFTGPRAEVVVRGVDRLAEVVVQGAVADVAVGDRQRDLVQSRSPAPRSAPTSHPTAPSRR
jgi:hypothetical protein